MFYAVKAICKRSLLLIAINELIRGRVQDIAIAYVSFIFVIRSFINLSNYCLRSLPRNSSLIDSDEVPFHF